MPSTWLAIGAIGAAVATVTEAAAAAAAATCGCHASNNNDNEAAQAEPWLANPNLLPKTQILDPQWSLGNVVMLISVLLFVGMHVLMKNSQRPRTGRGATTTATAPWDALPDMAESRSSMGDSSTSSLSSTDGSSSSSSSSSSPSPPRSTSVGLEIVKEFLDELETKEKHPWNVLVDRPELTIWRRKDNPHAFFARIQLENTAEACFQATTDERNWGMQEIIPKGSPIPNLLETVEKVQVMDEFTMLMYGKVRRLLLISARDALCYQAKAKLPDGRLVIAGKSIVSPLRPVKSGVVRATLDLGGAVFENDPVQPKRCTVTGIGSGDPNGWVPESLVNIGITQVAPQTLRLVNKMLCVIPDNWINSRNPVPPECDLTTCASSASSSAAPATAGSGAGFVGAAGPITFPEGTTTTYVEVSTPGRPPFDSHSGPGAGRSIVLQVLLALRRGARSISPYILWVIYFLAWFQFFREIIQPRRGRLLGSSSSR